MQLNSRYYLIVPRLMSSVLVRVFIMIQMIISIYLATTCFQLIEQAMTAAASQCMYVIITPVEF